MSCPSLRKDKTKLHTNFVGDKVVVELSAYDLTRAELYTGIGKEVDSMKRKRGGGGRDKVSGDCQVIEWSQIVATKTI
jgi:hypothetical protein